ncbi:ArsR/SmtB family transcription factor [Streptomyces sp. CMB-StM0423]|uniref:ArsR/SmtB family transcription factor n=1 Tax=Streptomyces sp. CMB-StM0423 TaxID=2059884 RepID=UPI000C70C4FF|nr:winged helix-turn-helix domain-containing protein [Streptomyces sp. CMB-StM0423]AUH40631.1 transcriptional regulator [Streptomyces sp. CMB-StM0423]
MSWENDAPLVPLRALANPLRIRIVSLLTGAPMSATEVAEELGIAHGSASYHLRRLTAAGFLRRADGAPGAGSGAAAGGAARRGQPPRRYEYDPDSARRLDRSGDAGPLLEALFTDLRRRAAAGRQVTSADAEVWLPRETWAEVCALTERAVRLVHDKAGPPRTGDGVHVSFTAMLLELGGRPGESGAPRGAPGGERG